MNAAQRRVQRRQIASDWPVGTPVKWGTSNRRYVVKQPGRSQQGCVMIADEHGRHFARPSDLKRVPA